jgi:hypothetical protein
MWLIIILAYMQLSVAQGMTKSEDLGDMRAERAGRPGYIFHVTNVTHSETGPRVFHGAD